MTITTGMIIIKWVVKLTKGFADVGGDDGTGGVVGKCPGVGEYTGTYGVIDVGEGTGTWGAVELVKQSLPVHPLTHVQVLGAIHCLLVPHGELQIAVLGEINMLIFTWRLVLSSYCMPSCL